MKILYVTNDFKPDAALVKSLTEAGEVIPFDAVDDAAATFNRAVPLHPDLIVGVGINGDLGALLASMMGIPYIACQPTLPLPKGGCGLVSGTDEDKGIPLKTITDFVENSELIYGLTD
jgi:hypothetical protein